MFSHKISDRKKIANGYVVIILATEMLAFPSKWSGNKYDSDPINEKTTPIYNGQFSVAQSTDSS